MVRSAQRIALFFSLLCGLVSTVWAVAPQVSLSVSASSVTLGSPTAVRWAVTASGVAGYTGPVLLVRPDLTPTDPVPPGTADPSLALHFFPGLEANASEQSTLEPGHCLPEQAGTYPFRARIVLEDGTVVESATVNLTVVAPPSQHGRVMTPMQQDSIPPLTAVVLTANPTSLQQLDTVALTATPSGGTDVQYKFFAKRGSETNWTVVQDYSTDNTCDWTPTVADYYRLRVWAKDDGSQNQYDVVHNIGYYAEATPLTGVAGSVNPASPQTANTQVTITATPTGGANLEYKFHVKRSGESSFTVLQGYAAQSSCTWTPTQAGYYLILIYCREVGSTAYADQFVYLNDYVDATPLTGIAVTASPTAPQPKNYAITLTGVPTGGYNVEYRYHIKRATDPSYTLVRDYSTTPTYSWTPTEGVYYNISLSCREVSNTGQTYSYIAYLTYQVTTGPHVVLTALTANATLTAYANNTLTATASDANGTVTKVEFYDGATKLGEDTTAPYSYLWSTATPGNHTLTAKARDNDGYVTASLPVPVLVNDPPSVRLTGPATGESFFAPATVEATVEVGDSDGTVSSVAFYHGATLLGTDTTAPFTHTLTNVPAGEYVLTAAATDNRGATTTSAPIQYTVTTLQPLRVSLTAPTAGQVIAPGSNCTLAAEAFDLLGTVTKVEFFRGSTKLGEDTTAPYTCLWTSVPLGSYALTAVATNNTNMTATSAAVSLIVDTPPTATADTTTTNEDTPVTISVLVNDSAADGQGLTVVGVSSGGHGHTVINANGTIAYTPEADWHGVDTFTYTIRDTLGVDNTGQVTVTVSAVTDAPRVTLATPTNGATYLAPASLALHATVTCPDGTVTKVEFFQDATKLGEDTGEPYSCTWNSIAVGDYTLTAVVTGSTGQSTSAEVQITVSDTAVPSLVTIAAPVIGSSFSADGNVIVSATPDVTGGTVALVEFFADNVKFGEDTDGSDGWSAVWGKTQPGIHYLSSRVTYQEDLARFFTDNANPLLRLVANNSSMLDVVDGDPPVGTPTSPPTPVNRPTITNIAPEVTLIHPTASTPISTHVQIPITGTARDKDGWIDSVVVNDTVNGKTTHHTAEYLIEKSAWVLMYEFDTPGEHTLSVTATDRGQRPDLDNDNPLSTTTTPITILVSNPSPTVSIVAPGARDAEGNFISTIIRKPERLALSAEANDVNGTIRDVIFHIVRVSSGLEVDVIPSNHVDGSRVWTAVWNCTAMSTGAYRITALAIDNDNAMISSVPVTVTLECPPDPFFALIEPWQHGIVTPVTPSQMETHTPYTFVVNAFNPRQAVDQVKLFVDNVENGTFTGTFQRTWSTTQTGHQYFFRAETVDANGIPAVGSFSASFVNPVPTIHSTEPVGTAAYPPGAMPITAYSYDLNGSVTGIVARLYDSTHTQLLQETNLAQGTNPFAWSSGLTIATPGQYWLALFATDNDAGQQFASVDVTITTNATIPTAGTPPLGPQVQVLSPTHDSGVNPTKSFLVNGNTLVFTGRAFDLTRSLSTMTFTVTGPNNTSWTKTENCSAGITLKSVTFPDPAWTPTPPSKLPLGSYTLTITARNDQNTPGNASVPFEVTNPTPAISITAPSSGAQFNTPAVIHMSVAAAEFNGTLASVSLTIVNASCQTVFQQKWSGGQITSRSQSFVATRSFIAGSDPLTQPLLPGAYTIIATVVDDEGTINYTTSTFTVVNPPPKVTLLAPPDNTHYLTTPVALAVAATATDVNGATPPTVSFVLRDSATDTVVYCSPEPDAEAPYVDQILIPHNGTYTLVAEAYDDEGASTVSSSVTITVGPILPPTRRDEPTDGDPVNLLRGEEEHTAPVDMAVYNPSGLHVAFQRTYSSALAKRYVPIEPVKNEVEDYLLLAGQSLTPATVNVPQYAPVSHTLQTRGWQKGVICEIGGLPRFAKAQACSGGLTPGWTHNYDVKFVTDGGSAPVEIRFPNGGAEKLLPVIGQDGVRTGAFTVDSGGASFVAEGVPDGTTGWISITLTWADGTRWVFGGSEYCRLQRIYSPLGQYIKLDWDLIDTTVVLKHITDSADIPLLDLTYNGDLLSAVTDARQTRSVSYGYVQLSNDEVRLETVSQINSQATAIRYGYHPDSQIIPMLMSVEELSPVNGSLQTTTVLHYSEGATASTLDWKITSQTNVSGTTRSYLYQGSETQVRVSDSAGNVLTYWSTRFDDQGREVGTTDAGGNMTVVSYDQTFPSKVHSWVGKDGKTITVNYDARGNVYQTITPFGTTTSLYGDPMPDAPFGRRASVQESGKPPVTFSYYGNGLVQSITGPAPGTTVSEPPYDTVTTSFTYDSMGNVLTVTGPGNDPNNPNATVTVSYNYTQDAFTTEPVNPQSARVGQPLKVSQTINGVERSTHLRYSNSQGQLTPYLQRVYDEEGHCTDYAYNIAGQVTCVTMPASGQTGPGRGSAVTAYQYPGGPVTQSTLYDEQLIPAAVRSVLYHYDAEGRVLTRSGDVEMAWTEYDLLGRVAAIRQGGLNQPPTTYFYDLQGRLASTLYPDARVVRYAAYDAAGRLTRQEVENDAADIVTQMSYAGTTGQLTGVSVDDGLVPAVTCAYNADGTLASQTTDGVGVKSYTYDMLGNVLTATTQYAGLDALALTYTYYRNGLRASMQTPATNTPNVGLINYFYDEAGRPTRQVDQLDHQAAWGYRPNGWLQTQTLSNTQTAVVTTTYGHDAAGQLVSLLNAAPGPVTLTEYTGITYDGAGNRKGLSANFPNQPTRFAGGTSYTYFNTDQLYQEVSTRGGGGGYAHDFQYDAAGNILRHRTGTNPRLYDAANHWIGELVDGNPDYTAFAYDALGNPTTYRGVDCDFDAANHLRQYGTALNAAYAGDDLRAWKGPINASLTERTYFLYDGIEPICELVVDPETGLQVTALNAFGAGGLYTRSVPDPEGGWITRFYTFDPQGTVAQRLDDSGAVLANDLYDVWGAPLACRDAADEPFDLLDDPWGYKAQFGYYTDRETDLILCTTRYYDPAAGRFLTEDPIGYLGGLNLYRYCNNNPVDTADPMGWCPDYSGDGDIPLTWGQANPEFMGAINLGAKTTRTGMELYMNFLNGPEGMRQAISGRDLWNKRMSVTDQGLALAGAFGGGALHGVGELGEGAIKALRGSQIAKVFQAALYGMKKHKEISRILEAAGFIVNKGIPGFKHLRPDAINPIRRIIYEIKPNNAKAIEKGYAQLSKYLAAAIEAYGGKASDWIVEVITY